MNTIALSPEQFIFASDNTLKTTSLKIAERFKKDHSNVLKAIDKILTQVSESFGEVNFNASDYEQENGLGIMTKYRSYDLTRDGFMIVVMSFTGKPAMEIKEWYINAFNLMHEKLFPVQYGLKQLPESKTKKALPGGLTLEQQDTIKALVKSRAEDLPKDKQAGAIIKQWGAIKKKFGLTKNQTYKEISSDNFVSIISLITRLPLEGELLSHEANTDLVKILTSRIKTLEGELLPKECPKYSAPKSDLKISNKLGRTGWLTYPELKEQNCLSKLLHSLKRDNHDVEGAIEEFNGLWLLLNDFHNRLNVMKGVFEAIDRRGANVTFE
jgi:Rha family phage regulatory protein